MYILIMREIKVRKGDLKIKEKIDVIYEKTITRFGNSAKLDTPKKHIGRRAHL